MLARASSGCTDYANVRPLTSRNSANKSADTLRTATSFYRVTRVDSLDTL